MLGTTPPSTMQGDFSILDRKSEENGVAEAASPYNENVGFMAYNVSWSFVPVACLFV